MNILIITLGLLAVPAAVLADDAPVPPAETSPAELEKPVDPPRAPDPKPDGAEGDNEGEDDPSPSKPPKKDLTDGLESLDPASKDRDLLEEAIRGMRKAQELIEAEETFDETKKVQQQVVKDLDDLIKHLQQQLQKPPSQSQSNQDQQQEKRPLANVQRPKPMPMPMPKQAGEQDKPKPGQSETSRDTSESKEERERREAEEARRRRLDQDVWGHLPAHVRQQLRNINTEKYLPKYAEFVRQYYDALAEKSRDRK